MFPSSGRNRPLLEVSPGRRELPHGLASPHRPVLVALELRRALFEKRIDALLVIGGAAGDALEVAFEIELGVEVVAERRVDRLLDHRHTRLAEP